MAGSQGPSGGSAPLLTPSQNNLFLAKMVSGYTTTSNIVLNGTSTGNIKAVYDEEYEMTKTTKYHSKGYYYIISVSDTDDVFYQVFKGNKAVYLFHKVLGVIYPHKNPINDNEVWKSVRKRTHLPATVGATYLEIDADIAVHKAALEHDDYAKGILAAPPDGLKMIEGLEKLAEGDPDDEPIIAYPITQGNLSVSGQGIFYAKDSP